MADKPQLAHDDLAHAPLVDHSDAYSTSPMARSNTSRTADHNHGDGDDGSLLEGKLKEKSWRRYPWNREGLGRVAGLAKSRTAPDPASAGQTPLDVARPKGLEPPTF